MEWNQLTIKFDDRKGYIYKDAFCLAEFMLDEPLMVSYVPGDYPMGELTLLLERLGIDYGLQLFRAQFPFGQLGPSIDIDLEEKQCILNHTYGMDFMNVSQALGLINHVVDTAGFEIAP